MTIQTVAINLHLVSSYAENFTMQSSYRKARSNVAKLGLNVYCVVLYIFCNSIKSNIGKYGIMAIMKV